MTSVVNIGVANMHAKKILMTSMRGVCPTDSAGRTYLQIEFEDQTYLNDVMGFDVRTRSGRARFPLPFPDCDNWFFPANESEAERLIPNDVAAGYVYQDIATDIKIENTETALVSTEFEILYFFRLSLFESFDFAGKSIQNAADHLSLRGDAYAALITNTVLKNLAVIGSDAGVQDVLSIGNFSGDVLLNADQEPTIGYSRTRFDVLQSAKIPNCHYC